MGEAGSKAAEGLDREYGKMYDRYVGSNGDRNHSNPSHESYNRNFDEVYEQCRKNAFREYSKDNLKSLAACVVTNPSLKSNDRFIACVEKLSGQDLFVFDQEVQKCEQQKQILIKEAEEKRRKEYERDRTDSIRWK